MPYKSTKTCNRFSQLIFSNESSSKRSSLTQFASSLSSKRSSSTQLTSLSSKRARNEKGKACESVSNSNLSSSSSEKKGAGKDFNVLHLKEKLDMILNQNSMIIKNVNKLLLFQENLEDLIEDMNRSRSNSDNKTFINVIKSFLIYLLLHV